MKFDELYDQILLNESPMRICRYTLPPEFNENKANIKAQRILVDTWINTGETQSSLTLFVNPDNPEEQAWIGEDLIYARFVVREWPENGIQFVFSWNLRGTGWARQLIQDYYLQKYDYVLSGDIHTPEGESFWKRLVKEVNSAKVSVYNTKENKEEEYGEEVWGCDLTKIDLLIKITK